MRYVSICSGIEAATCAWHPLGWEPVLFSEIDPFCRRVLAHHYPKVPLYGDFTTITKAQCAGARLLVGGTPCQSFSIAGLRGGMADARGNLAIEYLRLAERGGFPWLVWENVPGVLSSSGGRDFGAFLGGLAELGYGWAYRVLDAQHVRTHRFRGAVPQRRRRVFVVAYLGDWRRAAAVLFEQESLSGNPPPRREAGQGVAPTISARASGGGRLGTEPPVSLCLNAGAMGRIDTKSETLIPTIGAGFDLAHSLRGEGFDASEDGTGRGTPLALVAFDCKGSQVQFCDDGPHPALRSMSHAGSHANGGGHAAIAFDTTQITSPVNRSHGSAQTCHALAAGTLTRHPVRIERLTCHALAAGTHPPVFSSPWAVRRLTPTECERLQGFPDGYTDVPPKGKMHVPDGPRYKALGNSMAVNVMDWIGQRIMESESSHDHP